MKQTTLHFYCPKTFDKETLLALLQSTKDHG